MENSMDYLLDLAADRGLYVFIDNGRATGPRWFVEVYADPLDHDLRLRPLAVGRDDYVGEAVGRALEGALDNPDTVLLQRMA